MNTTIDRDLKQERKHRAEIIGRVHGTNVRAIIAEAARRDVLPHCDCSRCMLVRVFRDQFDAAGRRK